MNQTVRIIKLGEWFGITGTVVGASATGGWWVRPDVWPAGVPDLVGRGEMWFANDGREVEVIAASAAA